jgi:uncharacterized protein YdaU (DUF1376 family)
MSAQKSPAFQFYVNDFLGSAKVGMMSVDEVGAYTLLLFLDWQEGGFQFNEQRLAKWCRMSPPKFRKAWQNILQECFDERDGRLWNPRLDRERAKQQAFREKCAKGGKARAGEMWAGHISQSGSQTGSHRIATPVPLATNGLQPNDSTPSPSPSPSPVVVSATPTTARVRERLTDEDRPAFDALFQRVPDPDTWAAECSAMLDGMAGHHKATPAQLARAMRDYVANGKQPNIRQFRRYVEGAIVERAASTPTTTAAAARLWGVMKTYGFTTATRFTFDTLLQRAQGDGQITDPDGFRRTLSKLQLQALRDARTDADAVRMISASLGSEPIEGLALPKNAAA